MTFREQSARPGLPTTHYFLSLSRGDSIRTAMVRPALLWGLVALAPLTLAFGAAGLGCLAYRGDLAGTLRQSDREIAYRARLEAADGRLEAAASGRLSDRTTLDGRLRDLLARAARLERRDSVLARLATAGLGPSPAETPAGHAANALQAIRALSPGPGPEPHGGVRAYAPAPEVLAPKSDPSARSDAAPPGLDPRARLDLVGRSLDGVETRQLAELAAIDKSAARAGARDAAIVVKAGLDPDRLAAPGKAAAGIGGPYIPLDPANAPAFERAAAQAARDVAVAEKLRALMPFLPVRKPLAGEAPVSSPFGYRLDPFLGRPALHPGVDLLQDFGAEIRATAAGRVVRAGPVGGYGIMVEIDHGNGIATRYGHLSELLVAEGQEVVQGTALGRVGSSGRSTGPHLHYEVRLDGEPVDPQRFLVAGAQLPPGE